MGNPTFGGVNPYDVLGVAPDTDDATIAAAYHALARALHPDLHPDATPQQRQIYADAMARLNGAHDAIRAARRRGESQPPSHDGAAWAQPASAPEASSQQGAGSDAPPFTNWHPPTLDQCMFCGYEPISAVRFERVRGFVIWARWARIEGPMCRSCGRAVGRSAQNETLMTGWWGIRSFFRNIYTVLSNAVALRYLSRLAAPTRRDADVIAPQMSPMDEGSPIFARIGVYFAIAAVVGIGALVVHSVSGPKPASPGDSSITSPSAGASWDVGNCVAANSNDASYVFPISCDQPHVGKIVAVAPIGGACAQPTDASHGSYVENSGTRYCIDDTQ